jgi:hypothetical protein
MMTVQVRGDLDTRNFVLFSYPSRRQDQATIAQDAGRSAVLAPYTLMAKVAASGKWVPFTDETATDGSAIPQGIYVGDEIAAADIVAGDVEDVPIITFGIDFDEDMLVIENSKTLATVITVGTTDLRAVRDVLKEQTLIAKSTITISEQENT